MGLTIKAALVSRIVRQQIVQLIAATAGGA
jgi:hypothetical protein